MGLDPILMVRGSEKLTRIFGHWPSFHDAEVLELHLDRAGPEGPTIAVTFHVFEVANPAAKSGRFVFRNHTVVTIRFTSALSVELDGFNNQNAIFDLTIDSVPEGALEIPWSGPAYRVVLVSSWGVGGSFACRSIEIVAVESRIPPGSVYA